MGDPSEPTPLASAAEPPLAGRVALVTGVSRRAGIGYATAVRLGELGAAVFAQGFAGHDAAQPWGADPLGFAGVMEALAAALPTRLAHAELDFAHPGAPEACLEAAAAAFGHVDVLVANHALSAAGALEALTPELIDASLAVNVRATLLLVKAFAARHDDRRPGGRVVLLTSGQYRGPMPGELAYVAGKGAVHQLTASLAAHLAPRGILANTVDPGPTDTGWADPATQAEALALMPQGRWGTPEDAARLIGWLATDESRWVTGQVIASDGGFGTRA